MIIKWIIYYLVSIAMMLVSWAINPILAMCVTQKQWTGYSKRLDNTLTMDRYYLWKCFSWFQTFDNPCDEYYWGMYGKTNYVAIADYQGFNSLKGFLKFKNYFRSMLLRYMMRVVWLYRNPLYGFNLNILGFTPVSATVVTTQWRQFSITTWHSANGSKEFQVQGNLFITKTWYFNINIGWKAHRQLTRLMLAGRLIQFPRKA